LIFRLDSCAEHSSVVNTGRAYASGSTLPPGQRTRVLYERLQALPAHVSYGQAGGLQHTSQACRHHQKGKSKTQQLLTALLLMLCHNKHACEQRRTREQLNHHQQSGTFRTWSARSPSLEQQLHARTTAGQIHSCRTSLPGLLNRCSTARRSARVPTTTNSLLLNDAKYHQIASLGRRGDCGGCGLCVVRL
jgi:hypothetical protein